MIRTRNPLRPGRRWQQVALFAVLLAACMTLLPRQAEAWWNGDWPYRMKIDADTSAKGANVPGDPGHVQVLLRLHNGNFNFSSAKQDGSDLRVVAGDDRTPLHFQIEKFDGLVDQVGLIWIDVPKMTAGGTTSFYLYWGNQKAENGSDGKATFGGDDVLVYHFADTAGPVTDTTSYGNDALNSVKRVDGGMVGNGASFDGSAVLQIPAKPSLALPAGQAVTLSMWVHPDDKAAGGVLYEAKDGANDLTIGVENHIPYVQVTTAAGTNRTAAGPAMAAGWHLIDVEATDHVALYVDGTAYGQMPGALPALAATATLGGAAAPAAPAAPATPDAATAPTATPPAAPAAAGNFVGVVDEFRIVKAVEPVAGMLVRVASEGPSPRLLTLAAPEQASVFGSGYIGIILKSVTPDAWVVITILLIMAVISWIVMVGKGLYVGRVNKANGVFREAYRAEVAAANGDVLVAMERMHASPKPVWRYSSLFRLNDVAAEEVRGRLEAGQVDPDGGLSSRSVAAIRSALDARYVLETQRLNRLMVLLTIAIAGGPFIGLFGTVIGVMITFASIAEAGDVNVNAIAPGISAALLATVTGLFVAIPALFGYNYFSTRISDATSDMAVHIDTLVTRLSEGLAFRSKKAAE